MVLLKNKNSLHTIIQGLVP